MDHDCADFLGAMLRMSVLDSVLYTMLPLRAEDGLEPYAEELRSWTCVPFAPILPSSCTLEPKDYSVQG